MRNVRKKLPYSWSTPQRLLIWYRNNRHFFFPTNGAWNWWHSLKLEQLDPYFWNFLPFRSFVPTHRPSSTNIYGNKFTFCGSIMWNRQRIIKNCRSLNIPTFPFSTKLFSLLPRFPTYPVILAVSQFSKRGNFFFKNLSLPRFLLCLSTFLQDGSEIENNTRHRRGD